MSCVWHPLGPQETQEAQRQCDDQRTAASHRHQELTAQLSAAEAELQALRAERGTVELQLQLRQVPLFLCAAPVHIWRLHPAWVGEVAKGNPPPNISNPLYK